MQPGRPQWRLGREGEEREQSCWRLPVNDGTPTATVRRARRLAAAVATVPAVPAAAVVAWVAFGGGESPAGAPVRPGPAGTAPVADFDGDGHADLATGVASGDYFALSYGAASGGDGRRQRIGQEVTGTPEKRGDGVGIGERTVARDLDGDGYTDLAADVETYGERRKGGAHGGVVVMWGSEQGPRGGDGAGTYLTDVPDDFSIGGPGPYTLTAGDFDGDRVTDLVVAAGEEKGLLKGPFTRDGAASSTGATTGDVDNDGRTDLIVRRHPDGAGPDSSVTGPVEVFYGSKDGPEPDDGRHTVIGQNTEGVPGEQEDDGSYGSVLAAGDVNKDGYADVAVGDPYEKRGRIAAGAVILLKGGLTGEGAQVIDQSTGGEAGDREAGDVFGTAVQLLDMDGDGAADLAAGAPGEDGSRGGIRLLPGTEDGLSEKGARSLGAARLRCAARRRRPIGHRVRRLAEYGPVRCGHCFQALEVQGSSRRPSGTPAPRRPAGRNRTERREREAAFGGRSGQSPREAVWMELPFRHGELPGVSTEFL